MQTPFAAADLDEAAVLRIAQGILGPAATVWTDGGARCIGTSVGKGPRVAADPTAPRVHARGSTWLSAVARVILRPPT